MAHQYAKLAFTDTVKKVQVENNSRNGYANMEKGIDSYYLLSAREALFIQARDSFYMASVGETGWPYVQHRGGPAGFLKVINENTLGFADYTGNRQYISTGNFRTNDRVSLFLMDYPNKTRLKILGRIEEISLENESVLASLADEDYHAKVERGFIIHVEAFDWNCPKYITTRFTEAEVSEYISPIIAENKRLKEELSVKPQSDNINNGHNKLGTGELALIITGIRQLTPNIRAYELRDPAGKTLPAITAGAHLSMPINMPNKSLAYRQYSICSNPKRTDIYEIAVLNHASEHDDHKAKIKSASYQLHQQYQLGDRIYCQPPQNHFLLADELHKQGAPAVLIAAGIGITPIKAMAQKLQCAQRDFSFHYAGKSLAHMAFADRLQREFSDKLTFYCADKNQLLQLESIFSHADKSSIFYLCGPETLINEALVLAKQLKIPQEQLRYERFNSSIAENAKPISVTLQRSNVTLNVAANETVLDAMLAANIPALYSCKTGDCKTCQVKVLSGKVKHLDSALSDDEKQQQNLMCPCISRADSDHLTLDI